MKQAYSFRNAVIVTSLFLTFSWQVQSQINTNIDWLVFLGKQVSLSEELPLQ